MSEARESAALLAGLRSLASRSFGSLDDAALCSALDEIEQLGRLVDTARALAAAEVENRSRYSLGSDGLAQSNGFSRGSHLIEHLTLISAAEAARRIRLGAAIQPRDGICGDVLPPEFPAVAGALVAGAIGVEVASSIIQCLNQALRRHASLADVVVAEDALVAVAVQQSADLVAVHARVWREALDPDGAEPRDEELRSRRSFRLGREHNGMTPFSGLADPVNAALLRAALAERSGSERGGAEPRFMDPLDADSPDKTAALDTSALNTSALNTSALDTSAPRDAAGDPVVDPRTFEQRQFDVAFGLITAGLRATQEGRASSLQPTASVVAVITLADLENGTGVGWIDGSDEPVSAATVQRLACDAGITPIVLGESGEVLHLGLTQRLFSRSQRRALAVRDGGCVWPHCAAPPSRCEAHHVVWWENGGATDVDNGALLCPAHHHLLHGSRFTLRMVRGRPSLLAPPWIDPEQTWRSVGRARVLMVA